MCPSGKKLNRYFKLANLTATSKTDLVIGCYIFSQSSGGGGEQTQEAGLV